VTFDDENRLIMQVLSYVRIDDDRDILEITDSEIAERASLRKELRLFMTFATFNVRFLGLMRPSRSLSYAKFLWTSSASFS